MSEDTIEVPRELLDYLDDYAREYRGKFITPNGELMHPSYQAEYDEVCAHIRQVEALLNPPQPEPEEDPIRPT